MSNNGKSPAARLDTLAAEFEDLDARERLEILLDFAENLAPLSPKYAALRDAGAGRVHECMSPVWLWTEIDNNHVNVVAEVAEEAATVKGFVGLLVEVYQDATPKEVLAVGPELIERLGLDEAMGMNRRRGMTAAIQRVHAGVSAADNSGADS